MLSIKSIIQGSKVLKNVSWLVGGRILQMIISFVVNILTARYLGPSNYGLINYAAVYTGFFSSLCSLGLNSIIVKELIDNPNKQGEILGTAAVMKVVASTLSWIGIVALSMVIDSGEPVTISVVTLCSIGLIFQAMTLFEYWFQSRLESKISAIATLIAYTLMSAYKVVLLINGKSVQWFAVATAIDYLIISIILYLAYRRKKGPRLSFSYATGKRMLSQSYHFILSTLMVAVYGNTDKFMLKHMLTSSEAVAYYSTAVSICSTWVFVLQAIIDSFNPTIIELHKIDYEQYKKRNQQLYGIVTYLSLFVSLVITLVSKPAIELLYGEAYVGAIAPLRVITWYTAFSYLGVSRNAWLVCEGKQKYLKFLYFSAAIINILLNAILIPFYGATGAAVASLVTQMGTSIVIPLFIKPLKENAILMIKGLTFWRK